MNESLLLLGAIAVGVERSTEVFMNIVKSVVGEPKETAAEKGEKDTSGQNPHQVLLRVVAFGIAAGLGILVMFVGDLSLLSDAIGAEVDNEKWIAGALVGFGAAPTHEVIKYVEEKKNESKDLKKRLKKQESSSGGAG